MPRNHRRQQNDVIRAAVGVKLSTAEAVKSDATVLTVNVRQQPAH
jgi:hypothetical protein